MNPTLRTPMKTMSTTFSGPEIHGGSVMATRTSDGVLLSLSEDFVIPGAPAPHWQVAGDRVHRTITVPAFVRQVSRVRIYRAFAEVVLGEVSFTYPVM